MFSQHLQCFSGVARFPRHDPALDDRIGRNDSYERLVFDDEDFTRC
jgi:hypothetical protein